MPRQCCVRNCSNPASFRIPAISSKGGPDWKILTEKRRLWCRQIGQKFITPRTVKPWHRVCGSHFLSGKPAELWQQDDPDWIPHLKMGNPTAVSADNDRFKRAKARRQQKSDQLRSASRKVTSNAEDMTEHNCVSTQGEENSASGLPAMSTHLTDASSTSVPDAEDDLENADTSLSGSNAPKPFVFIKVSATTALADAQNNFNDHENSEIPVFVHDKHVTDVMEDLGACTIDELKNICKRQSKYITQLERDNFHLREENEHLKKKIGRSDLHEPAFEGNNEKVQEYTGLPNFVVLMAVFSLVVKHLKTGTILSPFQQLILCLMKMRLNLPLTILSCLFKVSKSTVSRVFNGTLNVLYVRLDRTIRWPTREQLITTMPQCFKNIFRNKVTVIVDCFEIYMERSSNLQARAQTYSNYKKGNTVKFLIGIAPQGVITFISDGWGGRTSDKHITEHCGFLNKLQPGDLVLADRGFNIDDSVALACAEVKIPAFTKGKTQLCPLDVERTRKLASVRIHVERVIGHLRQKYPILSGTVPIDYVFTDDQKEVTTLTQMVHVCSALTNLCPSVVPFE